MSEISMAGARTSDFIEDSFCLHQASLEPQAKAAYKQASANAAIVGDGSLQDDAARTALVAGVACTH